MLIRKLWAENFKSFGKRTQVPLSQFTLFIGPNNAGKSNVLEIPRLIRDGATGRGQDLVSQRNTLLRAGTQEATIGLVAEEPGKGTVEMSATIARNGDLRQRLVTWDGINTNGTITQPIATWSEASAKLLWSRLESYDVWDMDPAVISQPSNIAPLTRIGPRGEGAPAVLDHLRDLDPAKYEALQEQLRRCAPELQRVVAVAHGSGTKEILFVEKSGAQLPSSQVSDGLRFLLFFLLIVHGPEVPRTLSFEDIERGLHPRRIKDVVGFLRQMTRGPSAPQVLATTHSPLVLDEFRDTPEEVVVVERGRDGATTCTALPDLLATIKGGADDAALGDLWYSGVLAGVPSR